MTENKRDDKTVGYKGDGDTNCCWCSFNGQENVEKKIRDNGNKRKNQDPTNNSIVRISYDN